MRHDRGVGLLEMIVAVGIAGIIAAAIAVVMKHALLGQSAVSKRADLNEVKQVLVQNFDCDKSLGSPPLACATFATPGSFKIEGTWGNLLTDANGYMGRWKIQGYCDAATKSILFKVVSDASAGKSTFDPLTGKDLATSDLFNVKKVGGTGFCPNSFAAPGTILYSCPATQYVAAIDPKTLAVTCRNIVQGGGSDWKCPAGQLATGVHLDASSGGIAADCSPSRGFGGIYAVLPDGTCYSGNPFGGGCACPAGFSDVSSYSFVPGENYTQVATIGWDAASSKWVGPTYTDVANIFYGKTCNPSGGFHKQCGLTLHYCAN